MPHASRPPIALVARAVLVATLAAAVIAMPAAAVPAAHAAPAPSSGVHELQACTVTSPLAPGASGAEVRCLQYLLILIGLPARYSGHYDATTEAAIRWYQSSHPPLGADGIAGEQTLRSLGFRPTGSAAAPPATSTPVAAATTVAGSVPPVPTCLADAELAVGSRGQSVECLQRRMTELGLYSGAANGVFDTALQQAVHGFQRSRPPLQVDGRAGPRTLAALGIWSGVSPKNGGAAGNLGTTPVASSLTAEPNWNMTADGIPFYGNRTACSRPEAITIATEFARDGADIATQYWAVYIASREGGCRFGAININPATKDDSHCTFQINALAGIFAPGAELGRRGWTPDLVRASMRDCADAASDLWVFCGRGPWTPPYSCRPPWEGAPTTPMPPVSTTTTVAAAPTEPGPSEAAPAEPAPVEPAPIEPPVATAPVATAPVGTVPAATTAIAGP